MTIQPKFKAKKAQLDSLYRNGKFQDVIKGGLNLLKVFPESVALYNLIGVSNVQLRRFEDGIKHLERARMIEPFHAETNFNLGLAYKNSGNLTMASQAFERVLSSNPNHTGALTSLGNILGSQGRLQDAEAFFTKVIAINPTISTAYNNLANVLKDQGYLEKAEENYMKAIDLKPNLTEVHLHLSTLIKYDAKHPHFHKMVNLYGSRKLTESQRSQLDFAIAKAHDDFCDYENAFNHYKRGNGLRKKNLEYDISIDNSLFRKLMDIWGKSKSVKYQSLNISEEITPIFIVGMPRSGTTLIEQILSSHGEIRGKGELPYIGIIASHFLNGGVPINKESIESVRTQYMTLATKNCGNAKYFTDKMPLNFRFIPLILAALPNAKIVHVMRNPQATCWSNFKHHFLTNGLGYSYDLEDVVAYFRLYIKLMKLWAQLHGNSIINCCYDQLTLNPKTEIRKLLNALDISWDDSCLKPHLNNRSIRTASQQQVRKKIYKGSSDEWRNYQRFLNGLFDELEGL